MTTENVSTDRLREIADAAREAVTSAVLGQEKAVDTLLAAYMAGGHALLEGVPGLGKTLLARSFASALGVAFSRVQFTPDLMPADVVGTNVFDPEARSFRLARGPIFTQVLMADEINRTPPKTQSALLEAMQERQVTIDGQSLPLPADFFVVATQNPLEFEGVYPLAEAQLDRFLVRVDMGLPQREAELEVYRRAVAGELAGWGGADVPGAAITAEEAAALRISARRVHVAEDLTDYLLRLAEAVRSSPHVELGPSPRGALGLLAVARASALLEGRDFVSPDDLKRHLVPCWGHRTLLSAESELEGHRPAAVLEQTAASVEVPH